LFYYLLPETKGEKNMKHYLSPEDYQSMKRLSEEMQGKLEEMAQIAFRIAGVVVDSNMVKKFVHQKAAAAGAPDGGTDAPPHIVWVEIFDPTPSHPEMCVVFYSDQHAVLEVPCGTPITG
jgi:hypothetical protein